MIDFHWLISPGLWSLDSFRSVVNLVRSVYVLLSTKRNYKAYGVAGPICKFIYLYLFFFVLWLAQLLYSLLFMLWCLRDTKNE